MTIPFKGHLAEHPFAAVFAKICGESRSGVLSLADLETKEIRKRIGFKSGRQAYVAGGTINETLGRLLLKWGNITNEQYEKSLAVQKQYNKRTGEALLAMKMLTPQQLGEALQKQTEEKVLSCFGMPDSIYSFVEAEPPADKHLLFFKINPEKILVEGIRNHMDTGLVEKFLAPLAQTGLRKTELFDQRRDIFGFNPKETKLLQTIKNGVKLAEIISQSPLERQNTLKFVYLLLTAGLIEPVDTVAIISPQPHAPAPEPPTPPPTTPARSPTPPPSPKLAQSNHAPKPAPPKPAVPTMRSREEDASAPAVIEESGGGGQFEVEGEGEAQAAKAAPVQKPVAAATAPNSAQIREDEEHHKQIEAEIKRYQDICKTGTYFQLLNVDRDAQPSGVKKAYFKLAKKFHPDTNPDFFKGDFRDAAEEIFTCIGAAYNTLNDQKAREEYIYALDHQISQEDMDRANRALEAEGIFVKAEVLFKKGDFRGAQTFIEQAIQLNPDEPEYLIYYGWTLYKSTRGAAIGDARNNIEKAIKMGVREKLDYAYYYLGMLAKVEGLSVSEQERLFKKAVEANPQHTLAVTELRHLRMRSDKTPPPESKPEKEEKKKGGFFSRFKK